MHDIFRVMPLAARHEQRAAYLAFLHARDGVPDYERKVLPHREERMVYFQKPLAKIRDVDHAAFDAQYQRFDERRNSPTELVLLLSMLKLNAAESYGVFRAYDGVEKRAKKNADELELLLLLEETYHTRILLSTACLYGLTVDKPYTPPTGLRLLITAIAHAPQSLARPLTLASEIIGALGLYNMLKVARQHLGHDPELRDAIEERLMDVLIDEIGHISFNRMHLSAAGLAQARMLLPVVLKGLQGAVPEATVLQLLPSDPVRSAGVFNDTRLLPAHVRDHAFFA